MITAGIGAIPFGVDWIKILLHLFNFALLAVGLFFLLYKPVLKFINNRKESIKSEIEKGERLQSEAQTKIEEYNQKLTEAEAEKSRLIAEAQEAAKAEINNAIKQANEQAAEIKQNAEKEAAEVKKDAVAQLKDEVSDVAIRIAKEIIGREVTRKDNEKAIDDCINEWVESGK